jgi:hypothetical protein
MTTVRLLRWVIPALFVVELASGRAAAQSTGTLSGTVVDEASQVVPGVAVTLVDDRTAVSRSLTTDGRGDFSFAALPPGSYTLRLELSGFHTFERRSNVLSASGQVVLPLLPSIDGGAPLRARPCHRIRPAGRALPRAGAGLDSGGERVLEV